jgi:hypothetical protein
MMLLGTLLTLLVAITPATSTAATTQPADHDASTPRGALRMLAQALAAGDRAGILDRLFTNSPQEKQLADATAELAEATALLRKAAVDAFGESAAGPLGADLSASPEALKRIDAARVEMDGGDKATVRPGESDGPPLVLLKRDGVWRVPVGELSKDVESADVQRSIDAMNEQAKQMKAMAGEVEGKKYKSAVAAREELDKRILQGVVGKSGRGEPK